MSPGFSPNVSSSSVLLFSELHATSSSVFCGRSIGCVITLLPSTESVLNDPETLLCASHDIVCLRGLKNEKKNIMDVPDSDLTGYRICGRIVVDRSAIRP